MMNATPNEIQIDAADAARWSGGRWVPSPPVTGFTRVCHDTRCLQRGDLYVALRGEHLDGHDFVVPAFEIGAGGALVEASWAAEPGAGPLLLVDDSLDALHKLARGWRLALRPRIVGVTGSAGKTTVKELIGQLLAASEPTTRTQGNWNNHIGLPMSMLAMTRQTRFGVFEVGSNHPGEIAQLAATLQPEWGVVTNIGPAHMGMFGSLAVIAREKGALLAALPADGLAFLDIDGDFKDQLCAMSAAPVVTTSLEGEADYRGHLDPRAPGSVSILERGSGEARSFPLPRPGVDMARNLLLAVAVCRRAGLSWVQLESALQAWRGPDQRWQEVRVAGVTWIDDAYNANPLSMEAALQAFAEWQGAARKWVVLGDMLELGTAAADLHRQVGRCAAHQGFAGLVTVGALAKHIATAAVEHGMSAGRVMACASTREAARVLRSQLQDGDAVLLKASNSMRLRSVMENDGVS